MFRLHLILTPNPNSQHIINMKNNTYRKPVTVIRYSCITGNAVWVYRGPSKQAARAAYRRACEKEIKRVRAWKKTVAARNENIRRLISNCIGDIQVTESMTVEQKDAARKLLSMAGEAIPCCRDFYNHIIEERRRRDADRLIRQQMRMRLG